MTDRRDFFRNVTGSVLAMIATHFGLNSAPPPFNVDRTVTEVTNKRMAELLASTNYKLADSADLSEVLERGLRLLSTFPKEPPQWWLEQQAELGRS